MVANLSAHKRGWDDRWEEFSEWADRGQAIKDQLLRLVDEDTKSFNAIIKAFRLLKGTQLEKENRKEAIQAATRYAIEVPFEVMKYSLQSFEIIKTMAEIGNPNSISDAAVGALCARAAIHGAFLNVKINSGDLEDKTFVEATLKEAQKMIEATDKAEKDILAIVYQKME